MYKKRALLYSEGYPYAEMCQSAIFRQPEPYL